MAANEATLRSRVDVLTIANLVGMTVSAAREKFGAILNISPNAYPTKDGAPVDAGYVIQAGDTINFAVALGEKGC